MVEADKPAASAAAPGPVGSSSKVPPNQGNPALRMLGLPRLRAKLPSRNWLIFFTVVGSITAAVTYDRRAKKRAQQRWCNAVSPLSQELIAPMALPRRLTVYLAAPPGDGLRPSREFFQEYVKPILVAGAVDWEVVEARREGELRAKLAERIRKYRRKMGEAPPKEGEEDVMWDIREGQGIKAVDDRGGDLIIGRHTWKEYVRGMHEGWLGPVRDPLEIEEEKKQAEAKERSESQLVMSLDSITGTEDGSGGSDPTASLSDDASPTAGEAKEEPTEKKEKPKPPPGPDPALILTSEYSTATLPSTIPTLFPPAVVIAEPHILGFLNTPIRMYRFLTRRRLANSTGAQVATLLLASDVREFGGASPNNDSEFSSDLGDDRAEAGTTSDSNLSSDPTISNSTESDLEQTSILSSEETDWHKSVRATRPDGVEAVWTNAMVLDPRIARRMRTPVMNSSGSTLGHGSETPPSDSGGEMLTSQDRDGPVITSLDDGKKVRGNARDWKGGADRGRILGWWEWFVKATGFADEREIRGEFALHGLKGSEDD